MNVRGKEKRAYETVRMLAMRAGVLRMLAERGQVYIGYRATYDTTSSAVTSKWRGVFRTGRCNGPRPGASKLPVLNASNRTVGRA